MTGNVRYLAFILIVILLSCSAIADTKIGIEIYPEKIAKTQAKNEWMSTEIEVDKSFGNITIGTRVKTYIFGTDGLSWYPSSIKFTNLVSYEWNNLKFSYSHYCHHYFHQFRDLGDEKNKFKVEYQF